MPPSTDMRTQVLIVDDDNDIRALLSEFLDNNGLRTFQAADGGNMFKTLETGTIDLIVLDLNLPGVNGLDLCRSIRADSAIPIIMLTAKTHPIDRIIGLETGADDYVCKPFEPLELLSRIRSVLRRTNTGAVATPTSQEAVRMHFSGWTLDLIARHLINPSGVVVSLSAAEFRLLKTFLERPNRVLNRDQLMDMLHGRDASHFDRSIDLQISRVRQKIEEDSKSPQIIKTVRNEGYILTAAVKAGYQ
ncbi:MAG TPA: response regulator [Burkholderiales bacterium]|nr:response regulator [Burkholderiales bacterium]